MQSGNKHRTMQCSRRLLKVFCGCCLPLAASVREVLDHLQQVQRKLVSYSSSG